MAQEGDELRGSGRSVEGADLGAAVLAAKEKGILIAGGGHTMAAGFSLKVEKAEEFKNFLIEYFQTHRSEIQPSVDYPVDSVIDIGAVDGRLLQMLSSMEPFGEGNPEPRFALPDVAVSSARIVGSGHVSCFLVGRNGKSRVRAIAFGAADSIIGISLLNPSGYFPRGRSSSVHYRRFGVGCSALIDRDNPFIGFVFVNALQNNAVKAQFHDAFEINA